MAIDPSVSVCFEALKAYHAASSELNRARERLANVAAALGKDYNFYFLNISTPSVAGITLKTSSGIDGANWPTPEIIQGLLVEAYKQKGLFTAAYRLVPIQDRNLINVPPEWNR